METAWARTPDLSVLAEFCLQFGTNRTFVFAYQRKNRILPLHISAATLEIRILGAM
jgi:hypothetical protein